MLSLGMKEGEGVKMGGKSPKMKNVSLAWFKSMRGRKREGKIEGRDMKKCNAFCSNFPFPKFDAPRRGAIKIPKKFRR